MQHTGDGGAVVLVVDDPVVIVVVVVEPHGFTLGSHSVVVVLDGGLVVVLVVGGVTCAGAQRSWAVLGCTVREPNWSVSVAPGDTALGHFTL